MSVDGRSRKQSCVNPLVEDTWQKTDVASGGDAVEQAGLRKSDVYAHSGHTHCRCNSELSSATYLQRKQGGVLQQLNSEPPVQKTHSPVQVYVFVASNCLRAGVMASA